VTRTVLRSLLATSAAAALLAGCGVQPGAAATLDGRRISVAEVQSATTDAQRYVGSNGRVAQQQVLYLLAADPYLQQIAAQFGAGASESDARGEYASKGVTNPSAAALEVLRANIALVKLGDAVGEQKTNDVIAQVTAKLQDAHFSVNPRYGTFDAKSGRMLPGAPNWIEPTASPSPSQ